MKRIPAVVLLAVFLLTTLTGCFQPLTPEPITEPVTHILDPNGDPIPIWDDLDRATLDPEKFIRDERGRMTYADETVKTYTGVDVSVFQGDVDWEAVKADGVDFVMLRAAYRGYGPQGALGEDAKFYENFSGAKAAGLKVGVYFFSQAISEREAKEEADFLLEMIRELDLDYPVAYDWEHIDYDTARTDDLDNATITACAKTFCDRVKAAGYEPLIYFNRSLGYFSFDLSVLSDAHFWVAEYNDSPAFIYNYKLWQYTREGQVEGIDGVVDLNVSVSDFSGDNVLG